MNSLLVKKVPSLRPKEPTAITTANGKEESAEEATVYVDRFGRFCHNDVVVRFTSSATSECFMRRNGILIRMEIWRVSISDWRWISDKVQVWEPRSNCGHFKRTSYTRCPFEGFGRPIASSRCQRIRRQVAIRFQSGFSIFRTSLSGDRPDSHTVVVEQFVVEPTEKTHDDLRVSFEEESTDLLCSSQNGPRDQTQASRLAGTIFLHIFFKIRIVKFVSSRKLPDFRGGTARKREETVLIIHINLVMLRTADQKFPVKRTNLVCCIVTQSWCRIFLLVGSKLAQRKTQLRQIRWQVCKSSPRQIKIQALFTYSYSLKFIRVCEDFCWNHDKTNPYRSETHGTAQQYSWQVKKRYLWISDTVGSVRTVVERRIGMLAFFAKHTRQIGRHEVTVRKKMWHSIWWQLSSSSIFYKDDSRNVHRIRAEFWRWWDRRLDHRGLARHWAQRRVRSSRQKVLVQRSWNRDVAGNIHISWHRWFPQTRRPRTMSNFTPPGEGRDIWRGWSTLYFGEARSGFSAERNG